MSPYTAKIKRVRHYENKQKENQMEYSDSLKKNNEFQRVYRKGTSQANRYLVMYVLENHDRHMENRLGISVSKKVGNSVVRHRVTRLIRESYRLNEIISSGAGHCSGRKAKCQGQDLPGDRECTYAPCRKNEDPP